MNTKTIIFTTIVTLLFSIVVGSEYGMITYNQSEPVTIYSLPIANTSPFNSSPITGATCLFNLTAPNETRIITNGIMTHINDGYYKNTTTAGFPDEGIYLGFIFCNKTNPEASWETSQGFKFSVVDKYSYEEIMSNQTGNIINLNNTIMENITTQFYNINTSIIANATGIPEAVWTYSPRNLTYYAPTGITLTTIDLTAGGYYNVTYKHGCTDNRIFGVNEPATSSKIYGGRWAQVSLYAEDKPVNLTRSWICYWLQKKGTGAIDPVNVHINDINTVNISTTELTQDVWVKNCTEVGIGNFSGNFFEIIVNGSADWSAANYVNIGQDYSIQGHSSQTVDAGSIWTDTNEFLVWLIFEGYSKPIAEQLNEEVVNVRHQEVVSGSPEEDAYLQLLFKDFIGNTLNISSHTLACEIEETTQNGTLISYTGSPTPEIEIYADDQHVVRATWLGNTTGGAITGKQYVFGCHGGITFVNGLTIPGLAAHRLLIFKRGKYIAENQSSMQNNWTLQFINVNSSIITNTTGGLLNVNNTMLENITQQFINLNTSIMNRLTGLNATVISVKTYLENKYGSYNWSWLDEQLIKIDANLTAIGINITAVNRTLYNQTYELHEDFKAKWGVRKASDIYNLLSDTEDIIEDIYYAMDADEFRERRTTVFEQFNETRVEAQELEKGLLNSLITIAVFGLAIMGFIFVSVRDRGKKKGRAKGKEPEEGWQ